MAGKRTERWPRALDFRRRVMRSRRRSSYNLSHSRVDDTGVQRLTRRRVPPVLLLVGRLASSSRYRRSPKPAAPCLDHDNDGYAVCNGTLPAARREDLRRLRRLTGPAYGRAAPRRATARRRLRRPDRRREPGRRGELQHRSAGVCAAGTRTCVDGALACVRNQAPSAEVCTGGLDEDCDGQGRRRRTRTARPCARPRRRRLRGLQRDCQLPRREDRAATATTPVRRAPGAAEACNGRDDDCDGQTDDGNPGGGASLRHRPAGRVRGRDAAPA